MLACRFLPTRLLPTRLPIAAHPIHFDRRSDLSIRFWDLLPSPISGSGRSRGGGGTRRSWK
eukprot:7985444-Pyramimonas_sp.AAC.1